MHIVNRIELKEDAKEELLPDFSANFPYIASKFLLDVYPGSLIDRKYVMPLTTASQIELIPLFPENPEQQEVLELLRESFALREELTRQYQANKNGLKVALDVRNPKDNFNIVSYYCGDC